MSGSYRQNITSFVEALLIHKPVNEKMINSTKRKFTVFIMLTVSVMLLLAVGSCRGPNSPSISIDSPAPSLMIASSNITVASLTDKFTLVNKIGEPSSGQTEGHIVYYLDVTPPTHEGRTALTQRGTYAVSSNTSWTWENLRPGKHTLGIQLVTSDNMPLYVPQSETVEVTIVKPPIEATKVDLIAARGFFNLDILTFPAGGMINLTLVNDNDTPLNFSIYRDSSASVNYFRGEIIPARTTVTYHFRAPGLPGTYFFRSDTQPDAMTGTLQVQSEQG